MNESCECENCNGSGRFVCGRCCGRGCEDCGLSGEVECLFCVVYPRREAERLASQVKQGKVSP